MTFTFVELANAKLGNPVTGSPRHQNRLQELRCDKDAVVFDKDLSRDLHFVLFCAHESPEHVGVLLLFPA